MRAEIHFTGVHVKNIVLLYLLCTYIVLLPSTPLNINVTSWSYRFCASDDST